MRQKHSLTAVTIVLAAVSLALVFGESREEPNESAHRPVTVHEDGSVEINPAAAGLRPSAAVFRRNQDGSVKVRCVGSEEEQEHFLSGETTDASTQYSVR
jgi:FlaG/FlaF family flagellin (archaellin)